MTWNVVPMSSPPYCLKVTKTIITMEKCSLLIHCQVSVVSNTLCVVFFVLCLVMPLILEVYWIFISVTILKKQPQLLFNKYPICNQNVNHQFSTWSILEKDNKKTQIHVEIIFPIYFDSFYSHFLFRIQRKYNVLAWATKSKSWRWLKPTKIRNSVIEINKNKKE